MEILDIFILVLNCLLILIPFYIFFIYVKTKSFNNYSCYNVFILSFIITIDNFLRLFSTKNCHGSIQYIQAFLLTFLDKVLLTTITSQAYIYYLGVVKSQFYSKKEKIIFFSILLITIIFDLFVTIIFFAISQDITDYQDENYKGNKYFYYKGNQYKKLIDIIFNSIFLFINTYSIFILFSYILKKKSDASDGLIEDYHYNHHYNKIVIMLISNSIFFTESYLIIFRIIPIKFIDLFYLITCLGVDLTYAINKKILKETLKIFCINIYNKKYGEIIQENDEENRGNYFVEELL